MLDLLLLMMCIGDILQTSPGDVVFMAHDIALERSTFKSMGLFGHRIILIALTSESEKKFFWQNGMPINYDFNKTPKSRSSYIHSLNHNF